MENKKVLVDRDFLDELCGFLSGLHSVIGSPIYLRYIDKIHSYIDNNSGEKKENNSDLKKYVESIVCHIYHEYDGDEFEIYTLAYINIYLNDVNYKEGILACFVNAIVSVTGKDFNQVYNNLIKRING